MSLTLDRKAFIDILTEGQGDIGAVMQPSPSGLWVCLIARPNLVQTAGAFTGAPTGPLAVSVLSDLISRVTDAVLEEVPEVAEPTGSDAGAIIAAARAGSTGGRQGEEVGFATDLYGGFSVKWFFGLLPVPCLERKGRSSSRRLRSGSRSARKGVKGPKC